MACFRPLKAYRASGGKIAFDSKKGFGDLPLELPCGQCIGCRVERSRQWALRCVHEASLHERNSFVTLTYSPAHLPADLSLDVRHWQLFAKRLRKRLGPFRYFHCGEYGDSNFRPHFHAIIFGLDFSEDRVLCNTSKSNTNLFQSRILDETWGLGFATVGQVTFQSAAYVARYVLKKATGELAQEVYRRLDEKTGEEWYVRPEYVTMSRRPGVGAGWFGKFQGDVFPEDEVVFDGKRFRPPRFYDELLERGAPDELAGVKARRRQRVADRREDLTPERLEAREQVAAARLSRLKREV